MRSFSIPLPLTTALVSLIFSGALQAAPLKQSPSSTQAMRDLQTLASVEMQGRGIGTEGSARARDYILKRIADIGLKPCSNQFTSEFIVKGRNASESVGKNVIACQAGQNNSTDYIVVSAHYDHLGINHQKIYFGADDNASGVAGVLAIAEYFKQKSPNNNIVYAFFDGEEIGLKGAAAFIKQKTIPLDKIIANINFDMIARGDKNILFASGSHQTPAFKTLLSELNGRYGIQLQFDHDRPEQGTNNWTNQSDHYVFYTAGIPHLYFGVEDHADYHKPSDTVDKVNPMFFNGAIELLQNAINIIDKASATVDFRMERKKYKMPDEK